MVRTPQQNGVAERKHRHLLDTARALRFHASLPKSFWSECILSATHIINRLPMPVLAWKSPYEVLHGKPPDYASLRTMGCLCFAANVGERDKFAPGALQCIFLGYTVGLKGYRLFDLHHNRIFHSRDVLFRENVFPYKLGSSSPSVTLPKAVTNTLFPSSSLLSEPSSPPPLRTISPPANLYSSTPLVSVPSDNITPFPSQNLSLAPTTSPAISPIVSASPDMSPVVPEIVPRRSARVKAPPAWAKDYICPQPPSLHSQSFHYSTQPDTHLYPLFNFSHFAHLSASYVASLVNVLHTPDPSIMHKHNNFLNG